MFVFVKFRQEEKERKKKEKEEQKRKKAEEEAEAKLREKEEKVLVLIQNINFLMKRLKISSKWINFDLFFDQMTYFFPSLIFPCFDETLQLFLHQTIQFIIRQSLPIFVSTSFVIYRPQKKSEKRRRKLRPLNKRRQKLRRMQVLLRKKRKPTHLQSIFLKCDEDLQQETTKMRLEGAFFLFLVANPHHIFSRSTREPVASVWGQAGGPSSV